MWKKCIAALVAMSMLAATCVVSALTPEEALIAAVAQLQLYGIMEGDPDGGLRLNEPLTRAELAKICVAIRGVPAEAEARFSDVPVDHWAAGYICVASDLGVIAGDGDGAFRPDDEVTNQEAVKMLVSLLGYGPMAEQQGGYPIGYLQVGIVQGITEGLTLVGDEAATRGDVARMASNALSVPLMQQVMYGAEVEYAIYDGTGEYPLQTPLTEWLSAAE